MRSIFSLRNEAGRTLTQMMVMTLVASLTIYAAPQSLRGAYQILEKSNRHNEVLQNALIGMEELTRELRQAKEIRAVSPPDSLNGYIDFRYQDGEDYEGNTIYRYQRYEHNGSEDYLQYAWSNSEATDLHENLSQLAGPVSGLSFTCYKELGQPAAIPGEIGQIREVHIKMITYDDQGKANPIPLTARVYLRDWIQHRVTDNYVIFGHCGVSLEDFPIYVGYNVDPSNVGANDDIYVGNHTTVNGGLHHGAGSELIIQGTDVFLGPDYGCDEYILMPHATDFSDPQWWGWSDPPPSQGPVTIGNNEEVFLEPGVYGDLLLRNNSKLHLSSGTYRFSSITGENSVLISSDVSCGDVRVFVDGMVNMGNTFDASNSVTGLVEGGGAEHVYFETHYGLLAGEEELAWSMGKNSLWFGSIYAPYGDIGSTDGVIYGQMISGGSIVLHGGSPAQIQTPINATMADFVLSDHIRDYGYAGFDE